MANIVIADGIQHRRGTAAALQRNNPLPKRGEIMTEIDTGQAKCGDGTKRWNELPYIGVSEEVVRAAVDAYLSGASGNGYIDGGVIEASGANSSYDGGEITGG